MIRNWISQKKSLHSSIFMVILWVNLGSIIVLSAFNYYVFHSMNDKAYRESFMEYNQRVTNLAFENIDKQIIQTMLKVHQLYFYNVSESNPLFLPQSESIVGSSEKIRELTDELSQLQRVYPYLAGVDVYYETTKTIVTGFDKVHFLKEDASPEQFLPWYKSYVEQGKQNGFLYEAEGAYMLHEPLITYVKKISRYDWNGKDLVLAVHVRTSSFAEYIDIEVGDLTLTTAENQILYTTEPEGNMIQPDITVTTFNKPSSVSDLTYNYRVNDDIFYEDYNVTSRMFLWNFFISIAFNILVLILISFYNYRTYHKRVLTLSKKAGIEMDSSGKSFDSSLNILTQEITTLHAKVNSSKGLLFQSAVRSVILNRPSAGAYEMLGPYLEGDCVCTLFLFLPEKLANQLSIEKLQAEFPPGQRRYQVLFTMIEKDGLIALVVFDQKNQKPDIHEFIDEIRSRFDSCCIVSGRPFANQKDGIKNSYKTAVEAARYRFIFPDKQELIYKELNPEERKQSGSHLKLFEAMEKDLRSENLLEFKTHIEFLVTSFKNGNYGIDYCNATLRDLVGWMYQMMQQYQLDMWVVCGYDIREYNRQISDIDAFEIWMNGLCEITLKNNRQRKLNADTDVRESMIAVIEQHIEDDISLDLIAEKLHIRTDVASRMFRQMMGKGYSEYIKEEKLKRAVNYLEQGDSVKDIAEKLGYSSAQYFIKVFKDEYHITPHQFRKQQEKAKEKQ